MKISHIALLIGSHSLVGIFGFVAGLYLLPILAAPTAPSQAHIQQLSQQPSYTSVFHKELQDSDFLHWGEGTVAIGPDVITLSGKLAPGPQYKLYLAPEFVETEADFLRLKSQMALVGGVETFDNFVVEIPEGIELSAYTSVVVWCESFDQFITAAQYR
ncbi:DM13 domain-containing protein [Neiella marina]|uniref:DM13 domain-containing protein n=1 Tax=Neiella holothuriorum TaxID=2870530 RepID=A0ABS7EFG5_9GAMM|nr:DM13 domain-containing protein [Neiella holothuriorum]MBW8190526.1 DM13 domain-containing protein [Neiella holothuriorum]